MRNRLIELLRKADDATEVHDCDYPTYEKAMQAFYTSIADHLLANGVIVPPCAVGDTVYIAMKLHYRNDGFDMSEYNEIEEVKVENIVIGKPYYQFNYGEHEFLPEDFRASIFLTKEEAEAKLIEWSDER